MLDDYLKANLASWDEAVGSTSARELYDVEGFKAGRSSLSAIERRASSGRWSHEGTTLLHLQCHFGLDTLSWARRGAVVTGVDFSGEGIATARALADEVGLSARATFVQSDVARAAGRAAGQRSTSSTRSWGALIWLGDLERWAQVVAHFLKPGGTFYVAEFHPYAFLLADDCHARRPCASATPTSSTAGRSASTRPATTPTPRPQPQHTVTYEWNHGFAEILDPLLRSGLRLEFLHEFPHTILGLPFPFLEVLRRTACSASRATTTTSRSASR